MRHNEPISNAMLHQMHAPASKRQTATAWVLPMASLLLAVTLFVAVVMA
jgi:cytochrome c-type biogenesis protein CcmH/NrfF